MLGVKERVREGVKGRAREGTGGGREGMREGVLLEDLLGKDRWAGGSVPHAPVPPL